MLNNNKYVTCYSLNTSMYLKVAHRYEQKELQSTLYVGNSIYFL